MRNRFDRQLEELHVELIEMGSMCEDVIRKTSKLLQSGDIKVAKEIRKEDCNIDDQERLVESLCLKLLLQQQPVAKDLRKVSAALKMITDLERIADQAADISELSLQFGEERFIKEPEHILLMARLTIDMVKDGVQSYVNRDLAMAGDLNRRDDQVDELFETIKKDLVKMIRENPENADQALLFMMIAKYLERIGDHAVNIGEWAEYAVTGCHKIG